MNTLRHYQAEGVEFLKQAGNALLGDEPGVGKTAQIISLTQSSSKVLVLTMSSLKFQFRDEVLKWLPNAKVQVISGDQEERFRQWDTEAQFYVCNYELLLRYDWGRMKKVKWDYIVCDECTRLSNPNNKQWRALKVVEAVNKIAATGTAIQNKPTDVYGIFEWLRPGIFKNYYAFMNTYVVKDAWGGVKYYRNLDRLAKIIKPYYIRRTKQQVLTELPPLVKTTVPVVLSDKERKLYDNIKMSLLLDIEKADVSKIKSLSQVQNGIVKLMRLRQLVDSMELIGESKESSKLETLKELLDTLGLLD